MPIFDDCKVNWENFARVMDARTDLYSVDSQIVEKLLEKYELRFLNTATFPKTKSDELHSAIQVLNH